MFTPTAMFAGPAQLVDRVLRPSSDDAGVCYDRRLLPYADLSTPLGLALGGGAASLRRALVAHVNDQWWDLPVDAVHDDVTIEAADALPPPTAHRDGHRDRHRDRPRTGAIATFSRRGSTVLVLDLDRLLR